MDTNVYEKVLTSGSNSNPARVNITAKERFRSVQLQCGLMYSAKFIGGGRLRSKRPIKRDAKSWGRGGNPRGIGIFIMRASAVMHSKNVMMRPNELFPGITFNGANDHAVP